MEFWSVFVICGLALCVVGLLLYLFSLRASLKEVARELNDKLNTDTNTLLSLSSGDRAMRALAVQINEQLRALRRERLKLQNGNTELTTLSPMFPTICVHRSPPSADILIFWSRNRSPKKQSAISL